MRARTPTGWLFAFVFVWCAASLSASAEPGRSVVYIEDSPAAQELFEQAKQLQAEGRMSDAVAKLQQIVQDYPQKLMPVTEQRYVDAAVWVRRRIAGDDALLGAYLRAYSSDADRAVLEAMKLDGIGARTGALEGVIETYGLTDAGLRAGLTLAGLYLERADAQNASAVLDALAEHPRLGAHRPAYAEASAVAAIMLGDKERTQTHLDALAALPGDDADGRVEAFRHRLRRPPTVHPPADLIPAGERPRGLDLTLWETPIEDRTAQMLPTRMRHLNESQTAGLQIVPVGRGDRVFINERDRLVALDRNSGRVMWVDDWRAGLGEGAAVRSVRSRGVQDRRSVLLMSGRAYAVMGQGSGWLGGRGRTQSPNAIIACDEVTGRRLWEVRPEKLDASLYKAEFVGTPLGWRDRLYLLLRRTQASGFQDVFAVSLDAATGQLCWRRHVSSTVTANRYAAGPAPRMLLRDGWLYVSDSLGSAAAIDSRTGQFRWVHVLGRKNVIDQQMRSAHVSATSSLPPMLVSAGLIVPISSGAVRGSTLLDPRTGAKLAALDDPAWRQAQRWAALGEDVLLIGDQAVRVAGDTLKNRWSVNLRKYAVKTSGLPPSGQTRGELAVTQHYAVIPMPMHLIALRHVDGTVVAEADYDRPGNVLAMTDQVVVTGPDVVRSHMSWSLAHERLQTQIAQQPAAPAAGLSLAELAARAGHADAVLEGVDAAVAALGHRALEVGVSGEDPVHADAFDRITDLIRQDTWGEDTQRERLVLSLATITTTAAQESTYQLTSADFYQAAGRIPEALEHYQAVLLSDDLSLQLYQRDGITRQAGLEAKRNIFAIVRTHGWQVYDAYAAMADIRHDELNALGEAAPADLIRLARQYPAAEAAARALYQAAGGFASRGNVRAAAGQLRQVYYLTRDPQLRARAVGMLAAIYEANDQSASAVRWLRRVKQQYPTLVPVQNDQEVALEPWLMRLSLQSGPGRARPALRLPLLAPQEVPGTLVRLARHADRAGVGRGVPVMHAGALSLYVPGERKPRWSTPVEVEDYQSLVSSDAMLVLWSESRGRLLALDAQHGTPAWQLGIDETLKQAGDPAARDAEQPEAMREAMGLLDAGPLVIRNGRVEQRRRETPPGHVLAVGESVICIADRGGRLIGVDRQTGEVLWRRLAEVEQLDAMAISEDLLAVIGVRRAGGDSQFGVLQLLDVINGAAYAPAIEMRETPTWVGFAGDGLVAVASDLEVAAYHRTDGELAWRLTLPGSGFEGNAWASVHGLVVADSGGFAYFIDPDSGEITQQRSAAYRRGLSAIRAELVEDSFYVLRPEWALAVDVAGETLWRDAISAFDHKRVGHVVTHEHVGLFVSDGALRRPAAGVNILQGGQRAVNQDGANARRAGDRLPLLYFVNRVTGRLEHEIDLSGIEHVTRPHQAQVYDNALAIPAAGQRVLLFPGGL